MTPQICPYCRNAIQPLDNHGVKVINDKLLETDKGLISTQTISCLLTRCYIVEARRPQDE